MTRRERIAAERLAAGLAPRTSAVMPRDSGGAPMSPDVVAMPPQRPASVFGTPAPTSPDVVAVVPGVVEAELVESVIVEAESVVAAAHVEAVVIEAEPVEAEPVEASPVVAEADARPTVSAPAAMASTEELRPVAAQTPADRRRTERTVRRVQRTTARATTGAARPVRSGGSFRRRASALSGGAVLLVVAGLVVGTSVPAQAFYTPTQAPGLRAAATAVGEQSLQVGATGADGDVANRDGYSVTAVVVPPQNTSGTFTNDPTGSIQWPFPVGVPISSGFGGRNVAGCSFCSTFHEGADFAPGAGTPIGSVAAGTVIKVKADDGGYGNDVWVQHDVDGTKFVSVYGHMKDGSFKVVQGQTVTVGQELGEVGSTGNSTGPHLHLEIHLNDVPVDPIAWLKANAN